MSEAVRLGKQKRTHGAPATREGGWGQWALLLHLQRQACRASNLLGCARPGIGFINRTPPLALAVSTWIRGQNPVP